MSTSTANTTPSPSGEEPTVPAAPVRTRARPRAALSLLARRIHFLAGLLVAPFLVVLALTGLAYAFTPQINDLIYSDEFFVDAAQGQPRPLTDQIDAALARHPDAEVNSVIIAGDEDRTTQVVLGGVPGLQEEGDSPFSSESLTVYVDPYTGKVNGELVTVGNRPPAQVWLRELHGNLHLGEPGRLYSEFVASWLPFIVLGGLALWLGQRRRKRAVRALLLPTGSASGRARTRSWHGVLGLWLAAGLLAISVTGLTWSSLAGANVEAAITALDGESPRMHAPEVAVANDGEQITIDRAVAIAHDQGFSGDLTISPPEGRSAALTVEESSDGLPIRKGAIAIDPYTGKVTAEQGWDDYPLLAKLTSLGIDAHSGTLFGLANQILLALLAIGVLALLFLGYRMWWRRRPTGATVAPAPPPVLRRLPARTVVGLLVLAGLLGWLMPVFGVTLAAFLVADTVVSARRRAKITGSVRSASV